MRGNRVSSRALVLLLLGSLTACSVVGRIPPPIEHNPRWWEREIAEAKVVAEVTLEDEDDVPEPRCEVDVLDREPARSFDLVGLVEVKQRGPAWQEESVLDAARSEACRLGGDALVVLYEEDERRAAIDPRIRNPGRVLRGPLLRAAIIRYR